MLQWQTHDAETLGRELAINIISDGKLLDLSCNGISIIARLGWKDIWRNSFRLLTRHLILSFPFATVNSCLRTPTFLAFIVQLIRDTLTTQPPSRRHHAVMESSALLQDLEELAHNIDTLEHSLDPLLNKSITTNASNIPLLDKAKLFTLDGYAIGSTLFSSLRLGGVDAKAHPVFAELARIKTYFDKIKAAEEAGLKPTSKIDKPAVDRILKHALGPFATPDATSLKRKHDDAGDQHTTHRPQHTAEWSGTKRKFDDNGEQHDNAKKPASGKKKSHKAPRNPHEVYQGLVNGT